MKSNFTVVCPYCEKENDFTGDNWHDEFLDDSQDHFTSCLHCGAEIEISVDATYILSAKKPEYD